MSYTIFRSDRLIYNKTAVYTYTYKSGIGPTQLQMSIPILVLVPADFQL